VKCHHQVNANKEREMFELGQLNEMGTVQTMRNGDRWAII